MLNAHPSLVAPPECGFIQWNYDTFANADLNQANVRESFANAVLGSKKMETWGLSKQDLLLAFNHVKSPNYQNLCEAVFKTYASLIVGKTIPKAAVDKNNYYIDYLDKISLAMPHAAYIHLIRDVRDVAGSYLEIERKKHVGKYAPKLSTTAEDIASEWVENNEKINSFLENKVHLVVKYEDLLVKQKSELERVSDFLGIPYHDQMLHYYEFNDEPTETINWKQKTLQPIDQSRVGAFRSELAPDFSEKLWKLAQPTLKKFGYSK
jgi:hypothetical protein